jgi:hypothetical protein
MIDLHRCVRPHLIALVLGGWVLAASDGAVLADSVVSTLSLSNDGTFPGEQVGAAIQIGSTPIDLTSVTYTERFSGGPVPGESFAIFSRNSDGTVGSQLFGDFTLSYDSTSFDTTAAANSPFTFQANTSYWLMMVVAQSSTGSESLGDWDNSNSSTYTSSFGVTIPDTNASVSYFIDPVTNVAGYQYGNLADGLQLFQLNGTPVAAAVPEPSAIALAVTGGAVVLGATRLRHRRRRGPDHRRRS